VEEIIDIEEYKRSLSDLYNHLGKNLEHLTGKQITEKIESRLRQKETLEQRKKQ
jgi:hypothetical protein